MSFRFFGEEVSDADSKKSGVVLLLDPDEIV